MNDAVRVEVEVEVSRFLPKALGEGLIRSHELGLCQLPHEPKHQPPTSPPSGG
jgi:hypothetical protein